MYMEQIDHDRPRVEYFSQVEVNRVVLFAKPMPH